MGLKLAISGKGGVGKSTLAGTLARLCAADGRPVLAIDADPDANLAAALGFPADLPLHTIADERRLIEERTGARVKEFGQIFALNPDVSGIAEGYGTTYAGVTLLVLGAAQRAGGGCACPESVLLKSLVRDLVLRRDEVVILDMEAGIEHLGRGTAMGVDVMVAVVEPGQRSLETALRVRDMAAGLGIAQFAVVLNKSLDPAAERAWLDDTLGAGTVVGVIPYDPRIIAADRARRALTDIGADDLLTIYRDIQQLLVSRYARHAAPTSDIRSLP
jgi:CO dehydrogenase maturation factor